MPQESSTISSKFAQTNISTLVIMDEQEENTTIYSWKDDKLKKLPFDEHTAQSGQKIKTFYTFAKEEKVILINVNKELLCLSVGGGVIANNDFKKAGKPTKYYANKEHKNEMEEYIHSVEADKPVLFFSLEVEDFGEEIKGNIVNDNVRGPMRQIDGFKGKRMACVGVLSFED